MNPSSFPINCETMYSGVYLESVSLVTTYKMHGTCTVYTTHINLYNKQCDWFDVNQPITTRDIVNGHLVCEISHMQLSQWDSPIDLSWLSIPVHSIDMND